MNRRQGWIGVAILPALLAGCSVPLPLDRDDVAAELVTRTGHGPSAEVAGESPRLPEGVDLEDGLSEDEAVATALWNNAAFQEVLADFGFARADLITAGLLSNPVFSVLFPLGPKQLEFVVKFPLEALWLRPYRISTANLDAQQIAQRLIESGLNLVRDTRLAWIDAAFAENRVALAVHNTEVNERIAALANARLDAGDVSELEVLSARMGALLAREEERRVSGERDVAATRLRGLLGLVTGDTPLPITAVAATAAPKESLAQLEREALAARPDVRAAELAIEAAGERAGLARRDFIAISGIVDANGSGKKGFEIGPGLEMTLPFFNWNQAGRARAEAEIARAAQRYVTVRDGIWLEVHTSYERLRAANERVELWRASALPEMSEAVVRAEKAYEAGDVSLFLLFQTTTQEIAVRVRHLEAQAEAARALAELERSVGQRLDADQAPSASSSELR